MTKIKILNLRIIGDLLIFNLLRNLRIIIKKVIPMKSNMKFQIIDLKENKSGKK